MKRIISGLFVLLVVVALCTAAVTSNTVDIRTMKVTTITWAITTNATVTGTIQGISGLIERIVIPVQLTTNEYSVYLYDESSIDLLQGNGVTISNALIHLFADNADTSLPIATDGDLTFLVTNYVIAVSTATNGEMLVYHR